MVPASISTPGVGIWKQKDQIFFFCGLILSNAWDSKMSVWVELTLEQRKSRSFNELLSFIPATGKS